MNLLFAWILRKKREKWVSALPPPWTTAGQPCTLLRPLRLHIAMLPLALPWCCQTWNSIRCNLFLRLFWANRGLINTKPPKSCIKKKTTQTLSNLMEMMHNKADLGCKIQLWLKSCEQSNNLPCKLPTLALDFIPLSQVPVAKGTLSTSLFIVLVILSWSFAYFCKQVCFSTGWSLSPCAALCADV